MSYQDRADEILDGYGKIYGTTYWGEGIPNPISWGSVYSGLASFNEYAMNFDGLTPGESVSVDRQPFEMLENEGILIMAWVKLDESLRTTNYSQKCIVDLSSDVFSTANGKGYSLFVRRTATLFQMNFFYKRIGLSRSNCSVTVNLNPFDLSKPMLIGAVIFPDSVDGVQSTQQIMRVYQDGITASADYYSSGYNTRTQVGTQFTFAQNLCIGNTNDSGTVSSEFIGQIDEVLISRSDDIEYNYEQLMDNYWQGRINDSALDLNTDVPTQYRNGQFIGWYRMGDGATYNGTNWIIPNALIGPAIISKGEDATSDSSMTEEDRVQQIIN